MASYFKGFVLVFSLIAGFIFILPSCGRVSGLPEEPGFYTNPASGEFARISYADSVSSILPKCISKRSMVYSQGDYSFFITRYSQKHDVVLYVENGESKESGKTEKRYYVKKNRPVLFVHTSFNPRRSDRPRVRKVFFKSDRDFSTSWFRADKRNAEDSTRTMHAAELAKFEDAIFRRGAFDLTFERIVASPRVKYLIFSKNGLNSYRAPVKVEHTDEFIKELSSNPFRYAGRKLNISWRITGSNEALYTGGRPLGQN